MSFRDLRSFTEVMKALGYPRLISMENFRLPNFELVADCIYWLVKRYYPECDISDEISTEADRVKFLQSVAQVMLTKARMKLNIKRLYSADGFAVRELLKVATLLYKATVKATDEEEDSSEAVDFHSTLKGFDAKQIKGCATEIVRSGAALYDAMAQEQELREYRARAVAGHLDTDYVHRCIQEAISQVEDHVRTLEVQMEDLEKTERTIDAKIEKKKQELERSEKRLSTLQSVRPAYMDEYERLQGELQILYAQYLDRFRNLEFLENELEMYYRAEQHKMEESDRRLKKMQKRLAEEELRILRGEQEVDESRMSEFDDSEDDVDSELSDDQDVSSKAKPDMKSTMRREAMNTSIRGPAAAGGPQAKSMPVKNLDNGRQVMGSLTGGGDFDDDDGSLDEDDGEDDGQLSLGGSEGGGGGGAPPRIDDDDDLGIPDDEEPNSEDDNF